MQAGAAVSAGPFDANSQPTTLFNQLQQQGHRQSHRANSLSSGSVVTIQRPGSISRVRNQSPDNNEAAHISRRLGRDPMSSHSPDHKRRRSITIDPSGVPPPTIANDSNGHRTDNRWSHSTSSSLGSLANPNIRRNRSSSGAVLTSLTGQHYGSPRQKPLAVVGASPRSSPRKHHVSSTAYSPISTPARSRRQSRAEDLSASPNALPPLHTTPALTDPDDTESPSTVQTLSTPQRLNYAHDDYFDDGYGMAKTKRVVMVRNPSAPVTVPESSRVVQPERLETSKSASRIVMDQRQRTAVPDGSHGGSKRPRNREKMEKDKKTMLSKALQKANTAVLLDNAQNYEGALEAYGDACDLLTQVMDRTSGDDDKRKLDAIRVTYSNRMEELQLLVQERPPTAQEKHLPARPTSDDSLLLRAGPVSPTDAVSHEQGQQSFISTPRENGNAPQLSYPHNERDSFFSRTMAAVESSASFSTESGHIVRDHLPAQTGAEEDASERINRMTMPPPEHAQYMPRPLSPRRPAVQSPQSPKLQPRAEQAWQHSPERSQENSTTSFYKDGADVKESTSWLDPIDESGSSCSDSLHSRSSRQGTRRKHLRELSGETDPDFDAAFDAAVEAAYDEGFVPDLEARKKRETAHQIRTQRASIQIPASEIEEIMPGIYQSTTTATADVEEERILDDLAHDYGNTFNFDLKTTKSAIPRTSDSSGYSRSTWQSSQMSDRATAATSLSTVAEDGLASRMYNNAPLRESTALPPSSAPPPSLLPHPPSAGNSRSSNVRSRRLSGMNSKPLKIETVSQPEVRKRASTFHHVSSPFMEDEEQSDSESGNKIGEPLRPTLSEVQHERILQSPPSLELHAAVDEMSQDFGASTTIDHRPSYEESPGDLPPGTRPTLFRKHKSSVSLRDHGGHQVLLASPDLDSLGMSNAITPMSSTFMSFAAAKRTQNPLASQRVQLPPLAQVSLDSQQLGGGIHLFDTSLTSPNAPLSPRSPVSPLPAAMEPCPDPALLRPFWFCRALSSTIVHPRGGFLTTKLFIPRQVWETKGVKLKFIEDKIANCDLLTAALGRLAGVDTYDADAMAEELHSFEEVMDRVQGALAKKLGSDVGVHGVAGMFKDAASGSVASGTGGAPDTTAGADKAAKSNSGKSYLTSWRKLRNKSSGTPLSGGSQPANVKVPGEKDANTIQSVPMTSFVPVERRGIKKEARNLVFEGVNREYMGSLARLFDGVQILDQIARQVEDPGLKYSSPTHVGLELSIRHAAEFFGFYVCRFVLSDLGLLMDKYLKKGTEWVLA